MKKRVLAVLMILCLTTGLLPTTALAGNSSATMHTVTLAYNESLCTVSAYELREGEDGFNDPTYKNQLVTGNGQSAQVPVGTWLLFEITDIQSSYRIGEVTLNGVDRTEGFVNGGYGSLSFTTMAQDYNLAVTIEPIPDSLPTVTSVTLSTDAGGQHPAEDNITYTAESTAERLHSVMIRLIRTTTPGDSGNTARMVSPGMTRKPGAATALTFGPAGRIIRN